jgi:hypothetical protein
MIAMTRRTLLAVASLALLAGCQVPGFGGGSAASGTLTVDALAVTQADPETGNVGHKVFVRWNPTLNARRYEVIRKFGDQPASVKASQNEPNWVDDSMGAGQTASYKIQALSGDSKVLTSSNEKALTVLKSEVAKPTGLVPADNAKIGVGETPMLQWQPVEGATWYYVKVLRGDDNSQVYAALTRNTSVKFGEPSPVKLEKFADVFPVGGGADIARGVIHRWSVSALRTTGGDDPAKVTAIDAKPSAVQGFHAGG